MSRADVAYEANNMVPAPAGKSTVQNIFSTEDGVLICYGTTKPTDATTGYAPGCKFFDVTNGVEYSNVGTKASCNFDSVAPITSQAHIADSAVTTDLTGVDTGTDMTAAQAGQIEADLANHSTKINAILSALETAGILATS